jgi:sialate O-acetylesterase
MIALLLGGLFTDHMVLQQGRPNPVWGEDLPRQTITLVVEGPGAPAQTVETTTDAQGTWRLWCPELPVGGPYRIRVRGSAERVIDDVLAGEVWIASGQSNMEWTLAKSRDAAAEIAAATWPAIRVAKIPRRFSLQEETTVETAWKPCTPADAGTFTAIGYFFARDLHRRLGVPVGIIDATWGGTCVEAWTSREALGPVMPDLPERLKLLDPNTPDAERLRAEYRERQLAWERSAFPQDEGNRGEAAGWAAPAWDDAAWRTMVLPAIWQERGLAINGAVWFRHTVDVPAAWAGRDLTLSLGAIDDFDTTYFEGERVGAIGPETPSAYAKPRRYTVPARLVRAGPAVVAVRVFDRFRRGGLAGPADAMALAPADGADAPLPLWGPWRWEIEREIQALPTSVLGGAPPPPSGILDANSPTALFNGMIAPVAPYGLRGAIWYQGEANTGNAGAYHARFTALIRGWRTRWAQGTFPFYFVQLASFGNDPDWPALREAQARTLAEPQTGMAVAIDIGEARDIHPRNKQDAGARLARLALRRTYGCADVADTGPSLDRVEIRGPAARVYWRSAGGLRTRGGAAEARGFELAGRDGVFHAARAVVEGETVLVTSAAVPEPVSVRYAWAGFVETDLENGAGLPAEPFRTGQ